MSSDQSGEYARVREETLREVECQQQRDRLAKCRAQHRLDSRRPECEDRAASWYRLGIAEMPRETWSVRKFAGEIERSPRMHLDYGTGARSIPLDAALMLPEPAQARMVSEWGKTLTRERRLQIARELLKAADEPVDEARVA